MDQRPHSRELMAPWCDEKGWTDWPSQDFMPAWTPDNAAFLRDLLPGPGR